MLHYVHVIISALPSNQVQVHVPLYGISNRHVPYLTFITNGISYSMHQTKPQKNGNNGILRIYDLDIHTPVLCLLIVGKKNP